MDFAKGMTRWVILTNRYAIKIARVRLLFYFLRWLQISTTENGGVERRAKNRGLKSFPQLIVDALSEGIVANKTEYRLSKMYDNGYLAETLYTFHGLINVQRRGTVLEEAKRHLAESHPAWRVASRRPVEMEQGNICESHQFCTIDGNVCLADYGHPNAESVLQEAFG